MKEAWLNLYALYGTFWTKEPCFTYVETSLAENSIWSLVFRLEFASKWTHLGEITSLMEDVLHLRMFQDLCGCYVDNFLLDKSLVGCMKESFDCVDCIVDIPWISHGN